VVKGAAIEFSTIVNRMETVDDGGDMATVTTEDGRIFHFDEIVLTAPLGWLKQNSQAFSPPLPLQLTQAVNNIGYGCLEKVYEPNSPKPHQ
jgi:hypothetical protein